MARRGDEIQVAVNSLLRRMEIAEVVSAIDDPEFLVSCGRVQNLLVHRQYDESRESNLGANGNDVGLGVFDGPGTRVRVDWPHPRQQLGTSEQERGNKHRAVHSREHRFLLTESDSCFSNCVTENIHAGSLRQFGNRRWRLSTRPRWPRPLRRTRARMFGAEILAG